MLECLYMIRGTDLVARTRLRPPDGKKEAVGGRRRRQ